MSVNYVLLLRSRFNSREGWGYVGSGTLSEGPSSVRRILISITGRKVEKKGRDFLSVHWKGFGIGFGRRLCDTVTRPGTPTENGIVSVVL